MDLYAACSAVYWIGMPDYDGDDPPRHKNRRGIRESVRHLLQTLFNSSLFTSSNIRILQHSRLLFLIGPSSHRRADSSKGTILKTFRGLAFKILVVLTVIKLVRLRALVLNSPQVLFSCHLASGSQ
jgi:hypothetical protein